jgi:hypothetical protein
MADDDTNSVLSELRSEVEQLKEENAELRKAVGPDGPSAPPKPRGRALRWTAALVLMAIGTLLVPASIAGIWLQTQVTDTDRYVETVAPLADSPEIQKAISNRVTTAVFESVDVQGVIDEVLPSQATFLAAPISSALEGLVRDVTNKFLDSDQFQTLWIEANRIAHETLVSTLTGTGDDTVGSVSVDLSGVVGAVTDELSGLGIPVPSNLGDVSVQVFQSDEIASAQSAFRWFDRLATILPWIAVAFLGAGILVAPDRRWGATWAAGGLSLGALFVGMALAFGRSIYLDALPPGSSLSANEAFFDILVRFLQNGARAMLGVGLVLLLVALVTGPSRPAVRLRAGARDLIARAGDEAGDRGLSLGPVGVWVNHNVGTLRIVVGVIALITFIAWSRPSAVVILWIAIISALALGVLEFVARVGGAPSDDEASAAEIAT